MSYEGNEATIWAIVSAAAGAVITYLTKDKVDNYVKKQSVETEKGNSIIDNAEQAVSMMRQVLEVLQQDKHECHEKLSLMEDRLRGMENKMEMYRQRVIDLESKFGQA